MHQRFCLLRCNDENKLVIRLAIVFKMFLIYTAFSELYAVHLGDTYSAQKTPFLSLINTPSIKLQGESRIWRNSIKTWKMTSSVQILFGGGVACDAMAGSKVTQRLCWCKHLRKYRILKNGRACAVAECARENFYFPKCWNTEKIAGHLCSCV